MIRYLIVALVVAALAPAVRAEGKIQVEDDQTDTRPFVLFVWDWSLEGKTEFTLDKTEFTLELQIHGNPVGGTIKYVTRHPDQERKVVIDGLATKKTGTVFIFDLSKVEWNSILPYVSVTPILGWTEGEKTLRAVDEVGVGKTTAAFWWTAILVGVLVIAIFVMACRGCLICTPSGRLSLSKLQLGLWTLAIGSFVLYFGLLRAGVPAIPETLGVLMGLSVATGGIRAMQPQPKMVDTTWRWSDLISDGGGFSITRAQMLFWTPIVLGLFVFKTCANGELWAVPAEMVALMGISQAGYLGPSFRRSPISLAYASPSATYPANTAIEENKPRSEGGPIETYSCDPKLPDGLLLKADTGVISGTPTTATTQADYTITGTNDAGSIRAVIKITVT